jgi:hypothetical protein
MRTTCTWTERPYEALLFPGIGFGLHSLTIIDEGIFHNQEAGRRPPRVWKARIDENASFRKGKKNL